MGKSRSSGFPALSEDKCEKWGPARWGERKRDARVPLFCVEAPTPRRPQQLQRVQSSAAYSGRAEVDTTPSRPLAASHVSSGSPEPFVPAVPAEGKDQA